MKSVASFVLLAALSLLPMGCASVGREFDASHVSKIQNGTTTKPEVRGWFGEPGQITQPLPENPAGGVERWTYTYATSVAGGSTQSEALVVDFNAEDVVVDHAYSKTNQ